MAVNNNFQSPTGMITFDIEMIRRIVRSLKSAMSGKINCTGEFTQTASTTTTTVGDKICNVNSVILLQPLTANAAAAVSVTLSAAGTEQFVVTHANNAQTDRNFKYVIIG